MIGATSYLSKTTLVIGNGLLKDKVAKVLEGRPVHVKLADHLIRENKPNWHGNYDLNQFGPYCFLRDKQVTLLDGSILIPFCSDDPRLLERCKSLLPESSLLWVGNPSAPYGNGFSSERQKEILAYVKSYQLPFKMGKTRIEGGNVWLWQNNHWTPYAIIGNLSLILSILSLEEQGYFTSARLAKFKESIVSPSDSAIRQVRNLDLILRIKEPYEEALRAANDAVRAGKITITEACTKKAEAKRVYDEGCKKEGYHRRHAKLC